jgi:hypothetical protein
VISIESFGPRDRLLIPPTIRFSAAPAVVSSRVELPNLFDDRREVGQVERVGDEIDRDLDQPVPFTSHPRGIRSSGCSSSAAAASSISAIVLLLSL